MIGRFSSLAIFLSKIVWSAGYIRPNSAMMREINWTEEFIISVINELSYISLKMGEILPSFCNQRKKKNGIHIGVFSCSQNI